MGLYSTWEVRHSSFSFLILILIFSSFPLTHSQTENLLALLHALSKEKVLEVPESTDITAFFDILGI